MSSVEEFILVPKRVYSKTQPLAQKVLSDPSVSNPAAQLSVLQRNLPIQPPPAAAAPQAPASQGEEIIDAILKQLGNIPAHRVYKNRAILRTLFDNPSTSFNESGIITINQEATGVDIVDFLYTIQQPNKNVSQAYGRILNTLGVDSSKLDNRKARDLIENATPQQGTPVKPWANFTP